MKLLFQERTIQYEQQPSVEELIENINELMQDDYYFNNIVVDGVEVFDDPEQFLARNIDEIDSIEIIAIEAKEFINGLLLSAEEYTIRAVPQITALADKFYNHPAKKNWTDLSELFEGIQWLSTMIETIDRSIVRPANWDNVISSASELRDELENFEEALENTDTVLIGDMLQYEVLPVFEIYSTEFESSIDTEGTRENLS